MKETKLPETVKVGCAIYSLVPMDGIRNRLDCLGEFDHLKREMRVENTSHPVETVNTLIHEILHAIKWQYGIEMHDKEEYLVNATAKGLTAVFVDNPDLLKWFDKTIKE